MSIPFDFNPLGISSSSKTPLTFTFQDYGDFSIYYRTIGSVDETLQYNLNGNGWETMEVGASTATILSVQSGDVVQVKGDANFNSSCGGETRCLRVNCAVPYNVSGDIMSLCGFSQSINLISFFAGSGVVDASELILPLKELENSEYYKLFYDCYLLEKAPKILPATTVSSSCYFQMFYKCTLLQTAPEIMVQEISSDVSNCCQSMFEYCYNLQSVKLHLKHNYGQNNFNYWLHTDNIGTLYLPADGDGLGAVDNNFNNWNIIYF